MISAQGISQLVDSINQGQGFDGNSLGGIAKKIGSGSGKKATSLRVEQAKKDGGKK